MGKYVTVGSYWLGSLSAALALLARGLDSLGMNFIDFNTKGGGIGYHSLMNATIFFYMISIATAVYTGLNPQKREASLEEEFESSVREQSQIAPQYAMSDTTQSRT
jgi:hypothetical protein